MKRASTLVLLAAFALGACGGSKPQAGPKVVEKGLKMRVTGRDKNWVQVSDPATSSNGWIYSRFLKPTEPPEQ